MTLDSLPTAQVLPAEGFGDAPRPGNPRSLARLRVSRWAIFGLLLALTAASALLRIRQLNFYYWVDEGISVGISSHHLSQLPSLLREDGSPPLYYVLLHAWMQIWGRSEPATHVLSLVFALAAVPVAYWAGSSAFDRRTGAHCAVVAAGLPFLTSYAQETRMYSLVVLESIVVAASFVLVFIRRRRRFLPIFIAALTAALYSHNWALFLGLACFVSFLAVVWLTPASRPELWHDGALAYGGVSVLYLPWLPTLLYQATHTGAPWAAAPDVWSLTQGSYFLVGGRGAAVALLLAAGSGLLVVRASAGPESRTGPAVTALVVAGLGTLAVAWVYAKLSPAWSPRYLAVIVGPLLLLVGLGLSRAGRLGLVALVLVCCFWVLDPVVHTRDAKSSVASAAAEIRPPPRSRPARTLHPARAGSDARLLPPPRDPVRHPAGTGGRPAGHRLAQRPGDVSPIVGAHRARAVDPNASPGSADGSGRPHSLRQDAPLGRADPPHLRRVGALSQTRRAPQVAQGRQPGHAPVGAAGPGLAVRRDRAGDHIARPLRGVRASRRRLTALTLGVTVLGVLGVTLILMSPDGRSRAERPDTARLHRIAGVGPARVSVRIAVNAPTVAIPRSFLGFSTEYWTVPVDENHVAPYRRVIALLHIPGDGRFVLRIGGVSSDHSFWQPAVRRTPEWAFAITPRWIARTARVVRQSRLRVIIDLNLITATPMLNADLAREAVAALPRGSIAAFEIGNEPDVYNRQVWGVRLQGNRTATGVLPSSLTAGTYAAMFAADARSLQTVAPNVALQGPALADPRLSRGWISRLLAGRHPRLDAVSVHVYPYTACARPGGAAYPTIGKLLGSRTTTRMANAVAPAVRLARRSALPVRVSEFNSVTCGGVAGVSNSFATALWAPSALFAFIRAGVSSADLHVRAFSINAPFGLARAGVIPRPLLYGLILFTRMLRRGSRLARVRVQAPADAPLRVWAVRQTGHRLSVLLIDRTARPARVIMRLPSRRRATVQRLVAPSARATSGETLDGQWLGADLRWDGRKRIERIAPHGGRFTIAVRGMSAELMSVQLTAHR